jgi:hypothetical protein
MATGNVIGLLMEIGADPTKAEAAMARLDAASFEREFSLRFKGLP